MAAPILVVGALGAAFLILLKERSKATVAPLTPTNAPDADASGITDDGSIDQQVSSGGADTSTDQSCGGAAPNCDAPIGGAGFPPETPTEPAPPVNHYAGRFTTKGALREKSMAKATKRLAGAAVDATVRRGGGVI